MTLGIVNLVHNHILKWLASAGGVTYQQLGVRQSEQYMYYIIYFMNRSNSCRVKWSLQIELKQPTTATTYVSCGTPSNN